MKSKLGKWMVISFILAYPGITNAQFNTIKKQKSVGYEIITQKSKQASKPDIQPVDSLESNYDTIPNEIVEQSKTTHKIEQKYRVRKKHLEFAKVNTELPELTINNLLQEIRINGIQHEKIVLAQAILETGWFTSSVCRNKNNLFGLTNPKTGNYYEFNHWTESVRAYYTKVQYRYKGGNYLLWLDRIGYAEDPRYVSSLIRILRQYL